MNESSHALAESIYVEDTCFAKKLPFCPVTQSPIFGGTKERMT